MGSHPIEAEVRARLSRNFPVGSSICAGFSGGLDSTVLLDVLAAHARPLGYSLAAVHVHHGLSPNAGDWARACEVFCERIGVPLSIESVHIDRGSPDGIEASARAARHAVFAARGEDCIALAHHLDDQAETVLLQLLRGTGLKGIGAMPEVRVLMGSGIRLFRPLLDFSRAQLHQYALDRGLAWIEDESNAATRHDRNYVRLEIAPRLELRHPGWRESLARFARHAGSANNLLEQLASLDGVPQEPGHPLPLRSELPPERRANALRVFLSRNGVAMPPEARLAEIARQLYTARDDARVRIDHDGIAIVRHKGGVLLESLAPAGEARWRISWHHEREIDLGAGRGSVTFTSARGEGIAANAAGGDWFFAPRSGGETMKVAPGRPTRTLKNLLQEREIPAWQREKLPLLFHGDHLVWVPGVGIAAEYACPAGQEGLNPAWRVAGKAPLC
ncbi:MAG: tRNA lysidine(34) synthetase TilS [Usitatibacter sp.]